MPINEEEEEIQWQWMEKNLVFDKDLNNELLFKKSKMGGKHQKKKTTRRQASSPFGPPEQEIDLHGCEGGEALEKIDSLIKSMVPSGYKVLRIIHGGGNAKYGSVKHSIDTHIKTKLKHLIEFYALEPNNPGSSILKIK